MYVKNIHIANYKNYADASVSFDNKTVVIVGDNGMGKTNLLDAIYYLCIGKSYITGHDRNVVRHAETFYRISSQIAKQSEEYKVVLKVKPGQLKTIEINDVKHERVSDHIGNFPVVIVAPIDVQTLLEGSESRRLFLNQTVVQYSKDYLHNLLAYNRLLKQRNALLKSFAERKTFDKILLDSLSARMVGPAQVIHQERRKLIEDLSGLFENVYAKISGHREQCTIQYKSHLTAATALENFDRSVEKDRLLCRTTRGVHKDDIVFEMNQSPLKTFASQGQLKSFVLSVKLAQYRFLHQLTGIRPILLLDDLFDKLDTKRVSFLLDLITSEEFGQVFITDTDGNRIPGILRALNVDAQVLYIKNGSTYEEE